MGLRARSDLRIILPPTEGIYCIDSRQPKKKALLIALVMAEADPLEEHELVAFTREELETAIAKYDEEIQVRSI